MTVDLNEYQEQSQRTAFYPDQGGVGGLLYATLGLTGEAGEVANKVKKVLRDQEGHLSSEQATALADELGDVLWYVAAVADELGFSLAGVAGRNLYKLDKRRRSGTLGGSGDSR